MGCLKLEVGSERLEVESKKDVESALEKWEVRLKREFSSLKYPPQAELKDPEERDKRSSLSMSASDSMRRCVEEFGLIRRSWQD